METDDPNKKNDESINDPIDFDPSIEQENQPDLTKSSDEIESEEEILDKIEDEDEIVQETVEESTEGSDSDQSSDDTPEPEVVEAIAKILKACQKNHVIPGIYTGNAEEATRRIRQGFQFVTCMNDLGFFRDQTSKHFKYIREMAAAK
jgi:hypothetical protein